VSESTFQGSVAVIGIGEAGAEIAGDFVAAGWLVRAFDPRPAREVPGAELAGSTADAVRGADLVLSLTTAEAARAAATAAAPAVHPGAVYADLNTGSVQLKRDLAAIVEDAGALFADVAVMAPVPGRGLRTPLLASGSGAVRLAELLRPLGAHVDVLGPQPGTAAERKLLRSVFTKGLAAALLEGAAAAHAAGCEDWFLADARATLAAADEHFVDRLRDGSRVHAARRVHELDEAAELLGELGVPPRVTGAARVVLAELAG
jgi:3-hydroxyisobutyrate dehydrogenase-like beta-hydroxyacid dehydrogenase